MAEIKPFQGILYNRKIISNLSLVIAPPYDVISPEEQDRLYKRSPYNIVKLIKGKQYPEDTPEENTYTRASQFFHDWLKKGILAQDDKDTLYVTQDEFKLYDGIKKVRKGFFALFRLEDFGKGGIYPHEKTLAGPKEDRFQLMKSCAANFSPIFSLYTDPERRIEQYLDAGVWHSSPDIEVLSQQRILHRVWRVSEPSLCQKIIDNMKGQEIFIADGHHRYETALNYQKLMREQRGHSHEREPYDYCLMYFTNTEDEGLTIFPYHRVVRNISEQVLDAMENRALTWFDVKTIPFDGIAVTELAARQRLGELMAFYGQSHPAFGVYMGKKRYSLLVLKSDVNIDEIVPVVGSQELKKMDVNILHSLLFEKILGISGMDFEIKQNLIFTPYLLDAIDLVNTRECQAAFLVNPTRMEQVIAVALHNEKMPQKSTFFFPKLPSGLVIRKIS